MGSSSSTRWSFKGGKNQQNGISLGKKKKTTNLVTGKSTFKPPNKKREMTYKHLPVLCDLLLPLWCFLIFSPAGKEQNTTEMRRLHRRGGEKERVGNQEQFNEVTSAIRLSQTWCSLSLLLTSVVVATKFRRKTCVCLCAHTALSCEKGLLQLGKKYFLF